MVWLKLPAPDSTPELKRLTRQWLDQGAEVPAIFGPLFLAPKTFRALNRLNLEVSFGGSRLGRRTEEMVATTVSAINACFF